MGIELIANKYKKTDVDPTQIYANVEMDILRKTKCLCMNCGRKEEQPPYASCPVAKKIYAVCVEDNMAMMITKCGAIDKDGKLLYTPLKTP